MDVKIGELEELFERYRGQQDLRALSKLFDLAAPELLRLAVHMAPDVASAEDLVQQTFLVAIEKPRRWRANDPLLPWLFGILSKLAKKQRRALRRSPAPDRLAPRSAEDPARHTLDAETQSTIRSALEALPELYREVVRASLFDEKPPHEIARELQRAPGTVRMQLLRGLELLRRALPGGLAGGALVLCGTRGEAALKAAVLEKAAATPIVLATSTLTLGGLLVSTKAILATLVVVVGLCAWILWPRASGLEATEMAQQAADHPTTVVASERDRPRDESPVEGAPVEARSALETPGAPAAQPAGGVYLVGKVLDVAPEHITEIELQIGMHMSTGRIEGKPRADGTFEIDLASAGSEPPEKKHPLGFSIKVTPPKPVPGETRQIDIWARHPRYLSEHEGLVVTDLFAPLEPGKRREVRCDIHMRPAAIVSGRVRVPAGWKIEEVDVVLRDLEPREDFLDEVRAIEHSRCDADGRYTIKSMRRGQQLVRAGLPGLLPTAVYAEFAPGSVLELPDLVLEESACAIRGRVDLPAGLPRGDLRVSARRPNTTSSAPVPGALGGIVIDARNAGTVRELRGGAPIDQQVAQLDGQAKFDLRGLGPGRWELEIDGITANGFLPLFENTTVEAPAEGVVLGEQLGSIAIHVLDPKGPVKGALVTMGDGETFSSFIADDGQILVVGDLRKDYTASASAPGREHASLELRAIGRAREASFELRLSDPPQPASVVFRPAEADSAPRFVQLYLDPADKGSTLSQLKQKVALVEGRYELDGILPGHWKIRVGPAEEQFPVSFFGDYMLSEQFETTLAPAERFERNVRCERGGRLRIHVEADASLKSNELGCALTNLDGRSVEAPTFVSSVSGEGFGLLTTDEHLRIMGEHTQVALQDCLLPGRYQLRFTSDTIHAKPLQFEIKLGETTQANWKIEK
jgi:RNA polymerase sigma-70 factor (ECF subfamily)